MIINILCTSLHVDHCTERSFILSTLQFVPERRNIDCCDEDGGVGYLVSLLAGRRAVAVVALVLIVLGRLVSRRSPGLELGGVRTCLVAGRGRAVVLLQLESVLGVELGLLLQPAVILLLVLGVLPGVHWGLGRTSRTSVLLWWTSWTSIVSPGVAALRVNR